MLEDRTTHQALMVTAALLCGFGILLITASLFWMYSIAGSYCMPLVASVTGTLLFLSGLGVAQYIKWRMRT